MRKSTILGIIAILTTLATANAPAHAAKRLNDFGDARNSTVLSPAPGQGNRCVSDEGYGRWSFCDNN